MKCPHPASVVVHSVFLFGRTMQKAMTESQNALHHNQDQDLTICCNLIKVSHKVTFQIEFGHEGCAPDLLQFTDFDGQRSYSPEQLLQEQPGVSWSWTDDSAHLKTQFKICFQCKRSKALSKEHKLELFIYYVMELCVYKIVLHIFPPWLFARSAQL